MGTIADGGRGMGSKAEARKGRVCQSNKARPRLAMGATVNGMWLPKR